jgi:hypothetical protein
MIYSIPIIEPIFSVCPATNMRQNSVFLVFQTIGFQLFNFLFFAKSSPVPATKCLYCVYFQSFVWVFLKASDIFATTKCLSVVITGLTANHTT